MVKNNNINSEQTIIVITIIFFFFILFCSISIYCGRNKGRLLSHISVYLVLLYYASYTSATIKGLWKKVLFIGCRSFRTLFPPAFPFTLCSVFIRSIYGLLHWMHFVLFIQHSSIYFILLRSAIFEELSCYLWEQCIG